MTWTLKAEERVGNGYTVSWWKDDEFGSAIGESLERDDEEDVVFRSIEGMEDMRVDGALVFDTKAAVRRALKVASSVLANHRGKKLPEWQRLALEAGWKPPRKRTAPRKRKPRAKKGAMP